MANSGLNRNIPIKLGDFSVIDSEFNNIRERFDAEMKKMEDEMGRFRSELMTRESNFFKTSTRDFPTLTDFSFPNFEDGGLSSSHQEKSHKSEVKTFLDGQQRESSSVESSSSFQKSSSTQSSTTTSGDTQLRPESRSWLESLNSPLIQDEGDTKSLKLRFDVSQYAPEEIVVKTVDNKLLVHAKHEEKSDSKSVYREYNREFLLPKGTNPEVIRSSLSKDGVLTVEAPLPALTAAEKMIPIAQH